MERLSVAEFCALEEFIRRCGENKCSCPDHGSESEESDEYEDTSGSSEDEDDRFTLAQTLSAIVSMQNVSKRKFEQAAAEAAQKKVETAGAVVKEKEKIKEKEKVVKDKMSKKKLKKQRQKEKRKAEKAKEDSKKASRESKPKPQVEARERKEPKARAKVEPEPQPEPEESSESSEEEEELEEEEEEEEEQRSETDDETQDLLSNDNLNAAFVSAALKKTEKKNREKAERVVEKVEKVNNTPKPAAPVKSSFQAEPQEAAVEPTDFTPVTKVEPIKPTVSTARVNKRNKQPAYEHVISKASAEFGVEAITKILENCMDDAIHFLNKALQSDPHDIRHYLNRSYCYLRLGYYESALEDIDYVMKQSDHGPYVARLKFRMGQAQMGLKQFADAERSFEESLKLDSSNLHVQREHMRAKILRIMENAKVDERTAIGALQERSNTKEAIALLRNRNYQSSLTDDSESEADYSNDTYYSDEDDTPSNTQIISAMLNFDVSTQGDWSDPMHYVASVAAGPKKKIVVSHAPQQEKKVISVVPQKKATAKVHINDRAVWVGNLSGKVTDSGLKKRFSKFGRVVSIHRPTNDNYCFVNFESSEAVTKALAVSHHEVEGMQLLVKNANKSAQK